MIYEKDKEDDENLLSSSSEGEIEKDKNLSIILLLERLRSALFIRKLAFPTLLVVVTIWSAFLMIEGLKTVLDSEDGVTREAVIDPRENSFEAFVEQTWSGLIITENDTGELLQVALVAVTDRDNGGGTVLLVPPGLRGGNCENSPCTLMDIYLKGDLSAVEAELSNLFETNFTDSAVLTFERWGALVEASLPFEIEVATKEGRVEIAPISGLSELVNFLLEDDKSNFSFRQIRHGEFWRRWIEEIDGQSSSEKLPVFRIPVVEIISTLAKGNAIIIDSYWQDLENESEIYMESIRELSYQMFPFPQPLEKDDQPTVRLLNGSSDPDAVSRAQKLLRRNGGDVTVVGNFRNFNVIQTRVIYKESEMFEKAKKIAIVLGARIIQDELISPVADLTVLLGRDFSL